MSASLPVAARVPRPPSVAAACPPVHPVKTFLYTPGLRQGGSIPWWGPRWLVRPTVRGPPLATSAVARATRTLARPQWGPAARAAALSAPSGGEKAELIRPFLRFRVLLGHGLSANSRWVKHGDRQQAGSSPGFSPVAFDPRRPFHAKVASSDRTLACSFQTLVQQRRRTAPAVAGGPPLRASPAMATRAAPIRGLEENVSRAKDAKAGAAEAPRRRWGPGSAGLLHPPSGPRVPRPRQPLSRAYPFLQGPGRHRQRWQRDYALAGGQGQGKRSAIAAAVDPRGASRPRGAWAIPKGRDSTLP